MLSLHLTATLFYLLIATVISDDHVRLGIATVGEERFCLGYRTLAWTRNSFTLPHGGKVHKLEPCKNRVTVISSNMSEYTLESRSSAGNSATLVDRNCDLDLVQGDGVLFVKAPFSEQLTSKLNRSELSSVVQVRGDISTALKFNNTVLVEPINFGRIYWGSVIMYFFALVYVPLCAVVVEAGRQVIERHASTSPLERLPFTQTRAAFVVFLVFFFSVITLAFGGYVMQPMIFQPFFAAFLCVIAVVGFYHLFFPVIVYLANANVRIVNKTYWMVERLSVIICGFAIFGLWFWYRTSVNIWPLQLFLFACVGGVPNRYAPVNCILKCILFTFMGVFFSVLQRYILPLLSSTTAPIFVDIVTLQARIPDTISPGPIFFPDALEPSMMSIRVPLFGHTSPCSTVLDGTFGISNLFLPSLLIKAAMITDTHISNHNHFLLRNYTAGVLSFLVAHIAVFLWSFLAQTPVNSNIVYMPVITLGLILNSLRMGSLRRALFPPPSEEERRQSIQSPVQITVYKVTTEDQI